MQIGSSTSSAYVPDAPAVSTMQAESADSTTDQSANTTTDTATAQPANGTASPVKSFACGALGLDDPDAEQTDTNQFYTAGKVIAAAVTIGKIISLFV
jgi:hypothetical protein